MATKEDRLKIAGKVVAVLQKKTGVSAKGEWASQEYVIETMEEYPKKICFEVFGQDKIDSYDIQINDIIDVAININSREFNGRWYTTLRAWNVRKKEDSKKLEVKEQQVNASQQSNQASEADLDSLPF